MTEEKEPFAKFRKDAGLTLEAAATEFKVDRTTIIRWEKGEPRIPLKRLEDAKKILGATVQELRPDLFAAA
jgi:transcriptional regulator with XRE-family HTH domain